LFGRAISDERRRAPSVIGARGIPVALDTGTFMSTRWLPLAMLLASASAASADSQSAQTVARPEPGTSAIVGGETVPAGRWPDTVAVLGTSGSCTGTLIAPDLVLTAGHCANINPTRVVANTTDYAQAEGIRVNVTRTTAYPNWQTMYDVAVVELASPISGIEPRKLGTSCTFNTVKSHVNVHLVGFGATNAEGTQANTQLREAMTAVIDPTCAASGMGCKPNVAPGGEFIAGGDGTADSCFGDSGGPVYLDTPNGAVLIGAVSRGVNGASTPCGGGGIYVRTDKIVEWIENTTHKAVAKDACDGEAYAADVPDDAVDDETVGCNATGSSGLGAGLLVMAALLKRRRR
jgi:endonuclease G